MTESRTEKPVTVARVPAGQSIDLFTAVGALIDAALGGAMLTPGNGGDVAGTVVARDGQTERQVIRLLRRAARDLRDEPPMPDDKTSDDFDDEPDPDDPMTINRMREHPDGGVEFGIGGALEVAQEMARNLLAAFIPAFEVTEAVNYLEFPATVPETGQRYAVIVVKPDGLTPHEARQKAEREVERLRGLLAEAEGGV